MVKTLLYSGPSGSARSLRLDAVLREHWGRALLITPTVAYALRRRTGLLLESDMAGAWGAPVWEFKNFAVGLLTREGLAPRLLDNDERLWLLSGCLDRLREAGKLSVLEAGSETPGCARHFLSVITQLKQAGITPATFREKLLSQSSPSVFDDLTALIYEAYQQALQAQEAYDVPGLFWEVEILCNQRCPKMLRGIDTLLFEGFDDFTPSQLRVIEALSKHLDHLVFGLNYDKRPKRQDLYAQPKRTAAAIIKRFEAKEIACEAPMPLSFSQYAGEHCFWRDTPPPPKGLQENLTLMACSDATHEIEWIGRSIKTVLQTGTCLPDAVAVVFRNLDEVAETVRRVFHEFGIPLQLKQEASVQDSSIGRFLSRLFEAWENWAPDVVADVVAAPWFPCTSEMAPGSVIERIIREGQILQGQDPWVKRLNALREGLEKEQYRPLKILKDPIAALDSVQNAVAILMTLENSFPRQASHHDFAACLDHWLDHWDVEKRLEEWPVEKDRPTERCVVAAIRGLLEKLADQGSGEEIPRQTFVSKFLEALKTCTFSRPDTNRGVLCCDVLAMRNLSVEHVYFGGLNEGIVPAPPPGNAVYPENELARLRRVGIALEGKQEHADRERMLFHHVLSAAQTSLCLSWRLLKENGREASPSPYFTEIQDLFKDTPGVYASLPVADSFIADAEHIASTRDLHNTIFHRYPTLQQDATVAKLRDAATMEKRRFSAQPCDTFDGLLSDSTMINRLRENFGEAHEFSVNQLETYISCPFKFYAERLLNIEALDRPVEEFDPRTRGLIVHDILEALHRHYAGLSVPELPEDMDGQLAGWIDDAFTRHGWKSATAPEGLLNAERRRMASVISRYLYIERETGQDQWKPRYFEAAFGHRAGQGDQELSDKRPYVLDSEAGPLHFTGRIDRVDLNGEEMQARIVDYKSSTPPGKSDMKNGQSLQLTVYAWALEQLLLPDTPCMEAHYIEVGKRQAKGEPHREGLGKLDKARSKAWSDTREAAAKKMIAESVSGIRTGQFPPFRADKHACTYCSCKDACRYQENRIQQKQAEEV